MILDIFLIMLIVTLALIILGSYFEIPAITMTGLAFLFLLGMVIMNPGGLGGIEYKSGSIVTDINASASSITNTYSIYDDNTFGIFTSVIAMLWFIIIIINVKRSKDED